MRDGADYWHPKGAHTRPAVLKEMLLQICQDNPALPDPRTLKESEIRFFYEGGRAGLKKHTKPKGR